jgi:hypothetical protein
MWISAGSQARKESTNMLRWKSVIPCAILICFVVIAISSSKSLAGDAVSEHDELDSGPSFFGYAKEAGSLRSVKKVQVSAELGERRMSTFTNDEGSFKIPSFGKDTPVDNVTITCVKEGYRTLDISRRRLSSVADAPVLIECLLAPTP